MAKPVKVRTAAGEWADLAVQVPSANDPTFTGTTSSSQFSATNSSGDEGGEIKFAKAATNTTLDTGVTLDVYQDKVRLFETGGTNRGGYFDVTTLSAGVGTNLTPAMSLINTTTFTGVSSVSVSNVFSSLYENYKIVLSGVIMSTTALTNIRFRSGSTDNSSSNYYWQRIYGQTTALGANGSSTTDTSGQYFAEFNDGISSTDATIYNPYASKKTSWTGVSNFMYGTTNHTMTISGQMSVTTSYDGFTLFQTSGTFSGTVRVYGLK